MDHWHHWYLQVLIYFNSHRFAYVDFEDASEVDKAVALSGGEIDGAESFIERARPKGTPRESFGGNTPQGGRQSFGGRDNSGKLNFNPFEMCDVFAWLRQSVVH